MMVNDESFMGLISIASKLILSESVVYLNYYSSSKTLNTIFMGSSYSSTMGSLV